MKKLISLILFPFLVIPFGAKANDNFSVEIEALTLVMEQYKEDTAVSYTHLRAHETYPHLVCRLLLERNL